MDELTEAEHWLLLSLDADSPFWEVLSPITRHEGAKSEQIRPALEIPEAMQALQSLVSRGLVVVYDVGQQADEWVRVPEDGGQAVVSDPANWQGLWGETRYRAVSTAEGEAAYRRASEAIDGPWPDDPQSERDKCADRRHGQPIRVDPEAESANPEHPPFVARPKGAPVYYGFLVLDDVHVDGFKLGMISDWEAEPADWGDAFVVAPDDSRAGLMWEIGSEPSAVNSYGFEPHRWGVWHVVFQHQMQTREDARKNLADVLPYLRPAWEKWRATRSTRRFRLTYRLRKARQELPDWWKAHRPW